MADELVCTLPWRAFNVDYEGNACACCLDRTRYAYGSIFKQAINDLWNGEYAQYVRKSLADGKPEKVCRPDCPALLYGWEQENKLNPASKPGEFGSNQRLVYEAIKQRSLIIPARPLRMTLTPTTRCNYTCRMCNQDHSQDSCLPADFFKVLENYLPFLEELHLLGGEVFLSPTGRALLYRMNNTDYPYSQLGLITNGSFFSDRVLTRLINHSFSYIMVSIHAATQATYRDITGQDLWGMVHSNIERLIQFRERAITSFPIVISFTVMMSNYRELPQHLAYWKDKPVECLIIPIAGDRLGESIFETQQRIQAVLDISEPLLSSVDRKDPPHVHGLWRLVHVLRTKKLELSGGGE